MAKKTDYRGMKLDNLISSVNDQKSFWSKMKKMTDRSVRAGNISNEKWQGHFESFNEGADAGEVIDDGRFYDGVHLEEVQTQIFNADIMEEEILKAVKSLKLGKSAGLDGVIPEMLVYVIQYILPMLTRFFNRLFETGDFPDS